MNNKLTILILTVAFTWLFAACSSKPESVKREQEPEKETEKEIVPENHPCDPELPFD